MGQGVGAVGGFGGGFEGDEGVEEPVGWPFFLGEDVRWVGHGVPWGGSIDSERLSHLS